MSLRDPTGKLARWSIYLSQFDFEIVYKKGALHTNADCLSRPVLLIQDEIVDQDSNSSDPHLDIALMHFLKYKRHKNGISRN